MKKLILLIFVTSIASASPIGARVLRESDHSKSISLECYEKTCAHAVLVIETGQDKFYAKPYIVPMGNEIDPYQERWGTYNQLLTEASIRMPSIPEFRYLYLVNKSTKAYREAFKHIDASNETGTEVVMKDLFFDKLEEVLHTSSF